MNQSQAQISLDFSRDIAQLGELQGFYQAQSAIAVRTVLEGSMSAVASVITKKAMLQREMLDKAMIPGALSPEALGSVGGGK